MLIQSENAGGEGGRLVVSEPEYMFVEQRKKGFENGNGAESNHTDNATPELADSCQVRTQSLLVIHPAHWAPTQQERGTDWSREMDPTK